MGNTAGMRSAIVDPELRHWARGAFKPAVISGDLHRMRERELRRREGGYDIATAAVVAALAIGGGFVLGRWWKLRKLAAQQPPDTSVKPNLHLVGTDVLGAR